MVRVSWSCVVVRVVVKRRLKNRVWIARVVDEAVNMAADECREGNISWSSRLGDKGAFIIFLDIPWKWVADLETAAGSGHLCPGECL